MTIKNKVNTLEGPKMKAYTLHICKTGEVRDYTTLASLRRYIRKNNNWLTGCLTVHGPNGFWEDISL